MNVPHTLSAYIPAAPTDCKQSRLSQGVEKVMLALPRGACYALGAAPRRWTAMNNAQCGNGRSRTVRALAARKPFQTA